MVRPTLVAPEAVGTATADQHVSIAGEGEQALLAEVELAVMAGAGAVMCSIYRG